MKQSLLILLVFFLPWDSYGQWSYNGTHIYNNNSGNLGIVSSDPVKKLDITGDILVRNMDNSPGAGASIELSSYGLYHCHTSKGIFKFTDTYPAFHLPTKCLKMVLI